MLRHMTDTSQFLNETKKAIIRQKMDDILSVIRKENFT